MNGEPIIPLSMPSDLSKAKNRPEPLKLQLDNGERVHTSSSNVKPGITFLTVSTPTSIRQSRFEPTRPKARWKTPEFIFYGIMFVLVVPWMLWIPYTLSRESHPNYKLYARRLSAGWIPGRHVDNSDGQYRGFRSNVPALVVLSASHLLLGKLYVKVLGKGQVDNLYRVPFHAGFAILTLLILHGTSALKVMMILILNYAIGKAAPKYKYFGAGCTWAFNVGVLFLNEWFEGYKFGSLGSAFEPWDAINGVYPRWHVAFNITMLRLISFNMDYYWSKQTIQPPLNVEHVLNDRQRTTSSHDERYFTFWNYVAYTLYTPLYVAGPIITFNDFVWQLRRPIPPSSAALRGYAIRFVSCLLTMELMLHFMYVVAIKDTNAWRGDTPFELSMIGFWNLIVVWLKLLIPWRFFRLWALAEGIDPPENMVRCMANNYSTLGFWRSWHRSYNLWLIRYIYIPTGGSKNRVRGMLLAFTFVALWHDLSFKLLAWGWLVVLFVLPEVAARWLMSPAKYGEAWWYRHACAVGAVFNILLMMAANLVGFAIGLDGVRYMLDQLIGTMQGLRFMIFVAVCLFIAAQVMLEYREEEMRRGIFRKC